MDYALVAHLEKENGWPEANFIKTLANVIKLFTVSTYEWPE
jgi:hypothetical protein